MKAPGAKVRQVLGIAAIVAMVPASGLAFGGPGPGGRGYGPPKEAVDACAGRNAGDAVRFNAPFGDNVAATCREIRGTLIAVPDERPFGRGMGWGPGPRHSPEWGPHGRGMARGEWGRRSPEWGPYGRGTGWGPGRRFEGIARALDLTPAQQEKIRGIVRDEREKARPLREKLADTRRKIRNAVTAEPFDEAAVRSLAAEQAGTRADLLVSRARMRESIRALLTPEQRQRADTLRRFMEGRRHHRWM